jgi:hypothetical protein
VPTMIEGHEHSLYRDVLPRLKAAAAQRLLLLEILGSLSMGALLMHRLTTAFAALGVL